MGRVKALLESGFDLAPVLGACVPDMHERFPHLYPKRCCDPDQPAKYHARDCYFFSVRDARIMEGGR